MPNFKIQVPRSPAHPLTLIRVTHPQGQSETTVDDSHHTMHIELPEGVSEDEVDVVGEHCNARGQRDERVDPVVIRAAKPKEPPKAPETPTDKVTETPVEKVPETVSVDVGNDTAVVADQVVAVEPKTKPAKAKKEKPVAEGESTPQA